MVGDLQALIRIPSITGSEEAVAAWAADALGDLGLTVETHSPDPATIRADPDWPGEEMPRTSLPVVIGRVGRAGGRRVILSGHLDVVPPGDPATWTVDPWDGEIRDGAVYGRGACDMKGGIVANLYALRALRLAGFHPTGDVFVQSTVSEEDGGAGALAAVLRGYVADGALISEPTNLAIVTGQGGALMFRLEVHGLSGHACVRDEGVSAIEKFAYLHRGLLAYEARRSGEITHPLYAGMRIKAPINVGVVRGGSWPSSVPESLIAEGRAGLVPGEEMGAFKTELAAEIERMADADPWLRNHPPKVTWLDGQFAPAGVPADSPLVEALCEAWKATSSTPARIEAVTYGADMRHFVITGGVPCVMFGAGDVRLAHAPDESIPLEDLLTAITTTALLIANWCGFS